MRFPLYLTSMTIGVVIGVATGCFNAWLHRMQPAEQAAWMQVVVSVIAAGVAIWAVRQPIIANERLHRRSQAEKQSDREAHAAILAGICLDDLYDVLVRLRVAELFFLEFPDNRILNDVLVDLTNIHADTFLKTVERVELFSRDDGIAFGLAANRIQGIKRMGTLNVPRIHTMTLQMLDAIWLQGAPVVSDGVKTVTAAFKRAAEIAGAGVDNSDLAVAHAEAQFPAMKAAYLERL